MATLLPLEWCYVLDSNLTDGIVCPFTRLLKPLLSKFHKNFIGTESLMENILEAKTNMPFDLIFQHIHQQKYAFITHYTSVL